MPTLLKTSRRPARLLMLAACSFASAPIFAQATDAVRDQYIALMSQSTMDDSTLKPWHMKLSATLHNGKDKPDESGTIELWASGPSLRVVLLSGSEKRTELRSENKLYSDGELTPAISRLSVLLNQILHPELSASEVSSAKWKLTHDKIGKSVLDCVGPTWVSEWPGVSIHPGGAFCTSQASAHLVLTYAGLTHVWMRRMTGKFQGKTVPMELLLAFQGSEMRAESKIEQLNTYTPSPDDFVPSAGMSELVQPVVIERDDARASEKVFGDPPHYPPDARSRRVAGEVDMTGLLDTEGRIQSVTVTKGDPVLSAAASDALKKWIFRPVRVAGDPVAARVEFVMHFNLNN